MSACAESSAGTIDAHVRHPEQSASSGVYIDVFEQSQLNHAPNKGWNFLASVSAELLAISVAILIPLIYSDHLPQVRWKDILMGPAPRPVEPEPMRNPPSGGPSRPSILRTFTPPAWTKPVPAAASAGPEALATPGIAVDAAFLAAGAIPIAKFFAVTPAAPPPKAAAERPKPSPEPMRISGGVQMAKLIRKVIPVYPPVAKQLRISGVVRLIGTIGKDGTIRNLQLIDGHPMLARAAIDAVEQWIYQPTLLNGQPVEVIAPIEVSFTLSQ